MKNTKFYNLAGGIDSLNTDEKLAQSEKIIAWKDSLNVEILDNGGIGTMKGYTTIATKSGVKIISGFDYIYGDNHLCLVVTDEGKLYSVNTTTGVFTLIHSGLNASARCKFVNFYNGVFISNGSDDPIFYAEGSGFTATGKVAVTSGSNIVTGTDTNFTLETEKGYYVTINGEEKLVTAIASDTQLTVSTNFAASASNKDMTIGEVKQCNCTVDGVNIYSQAVTAFKGRLFIGYEDKVYFSALGKYNDWTTENDAGYFPAGHNNSSNVIALETYGDFLAIHTSNSVTLMSGSEPANFATIPWGDKGSVSPWGVINFNDQHIFFDSTPEGLGVWALAKNQLGQIKMSENMAEIIKNSLSDIDIPNLDKLIIIPNTEKKQLWFYLPIKGQSDLYKVWIAHFTSNGIAWYPRITQSVKCAWNYNGSLLVGTENGTICREDYSEEYSEVVELLDDYIVDINVAITDNIAYFTGNTGDIKPNAVNTDGIPYHVYEDYQQNYITATATTSECLSLFLRALVICGELTYAKTIADYIQNQLFFNSINLPHWMVDLAGGTQTEIDICGNYDSASVAFVNGVGTIPDGSPLYGENVIPETSFRTGVRACFSSDATFLYKDYNLENVTGTKYTIESYTTDSNGTVITLDNKAITATLQVYYIRYDGNTLAKNDKFYTYPCIKKANVTGNNNNRVATDAALWSALGFNDYGVAASDTTYNTVATNILTKLNTDMLINTSDWYVFDSTQRGVHWSAISAYDENSNRNLSFSMEDDIYFRFTYGADAGAGATSWAVGVDFEINSNDVEIRVRGDNSNALRQFVIQDSTDLEYYYPWIDDTADMRTFELQKELCSALNDVAFDRSRISYISDYSAQDTGSTCVESDDLTYNSVYTDTDGLYYPIWRKVVYNHVDSVGSYCKWGIGISDSVVSDSTGHLEIVAGSNASKTVDVIVKDNNDVDHTYTGLIISDSPDVYSLDWTAFSGTIAHPIKNVEISFAAGDSGTLYIGAVLVDDRVIFTEDSSQLIKFETRDTSAGYFDVVFTRVENGNLDTYNYSGVPVFSLEYNEYGIMAWRSGSYSGYVSPLAWYGNNSNNLNVAMDFLYDAQSAYSSTYSKSGPFMPVYLRNLPENTGYGTLKTWTFNGADTNSNWAGYQYRPLADIAEYYYINYAENKARDPKAKIIIENWIEFLQDYYIKNSGVIPSDFNSDGSIENNYNAVDFYALVGRAAMYKYIVDKDGTAKALMLNMLNNLFALQEDNGSFKIEGQFTFNFHQAEALLFLGNLQNFYNLLNANYTPVDSYWYSPYFHISEPSRKKTADKLVISASRDNNNKFDLVFRKNYLPVNSSSIKKITINDVTVGQRSWKPKKINVAGSWYSLQIKLSTSGSENFKINGFELEEVELDD